MGRSLLAPLVLLAACARAPERPSVVLVLVDQLRHDAAERWMPGTLTLAERGLRCTDMRAVAPWTYPSVISLFSGLYPQQHGANANQEGTRLTTIAEGVPLLPRTLRAAGYHTAGFVTNPFLHESNRPVRAAFEHFDASFIGDQGMTRGHGELVWTERMFADTVNAAVRAHFDARALDGPEFTYVHYIDVHGRREGPERWRGAPFAPTYEAAARFVDARVCELYEYFHARYGGELLFLVTSDHGQDLGDDVAVGDGEPWRRRKASLHDFNLRIPFFVLPGGPVAGPAVVSAPCTNVDVAPTVLDWLDLPPQGASPGQSLLELLAEPPPERLLYARNETGGRLEESLVAGARKFVRYRDPASGAVRLRRQFDLARDPRETADLGADLGLEERLDQTAHEGPRFPATFEALDPERLRTLQALGYAGEDD